MNKDKKMTEKILNHTLDIIYLLTGEEYTLVKKSPLHNIHQLTREGNTDEHKDMMDENYQTLRTFRIPGNKSSGLQDEHVDTVSEEGKDAKGILQVTIHSELSAGHEEHSVVSKLDQELDQPNVRRKQQVKEEEIPVDISEGVHNENLDVKLIIKEEEDERDKDDILQVTVHSDLCDDGFMTQDISEEHQDCVMEDFSFSHTYQGANQISRKPTSKNLNISVVTSEGIDIEQGLHVFSDCGKGSTSNNGHDKQQHKENPLVCTDCGRVFTCNASLVIHQRVHTGEKPYTCSDCGKCFSQASNLNSHKKIHTGERPFECSDCGKCFRRASYLIAHKKIHTGERPFSCSDCGKGFIHVSSLNAHKKTHTGERPFACSECGKCFTQRSCLMKHARVHTD
ncbi:uncharacterized protein O3C94_016817 isoform 2-T2 [Discoglossus pictus]